MKWSRLFGAGEGMNRLSIVDEASALLPIHHGNIVPSFFDPVEVTKVAMRLRYLIEEAVPCELEEELITKAHSRVITPKVIKAAKDAGGDDYAACVVYCLLVNRRWFKRQAYREIWDAPLFNVRAVAAEMIAKYIIDQEERTAYLMQCVLLKRYSTIADGEPTSLANVIEKAVDLHALRVIGSSGYQRTMHHLWRGWLVQDEEDPTRFIEYKEKANTNYFAHLNPHRLRAPIYQNSIQVIFSIAYLALYTAAIDTINRTGDLDIIEGLLYIFTFGFICDEVSKIWKIGRYYLGFWNIFNLVLYALLATSLILRFVALGHLLEEGGPRERFNELSYNFLAFSAPMFWIRLLLFLDAFRFFGAMLVVLKVMMKESIIFFALLIVVVIGFLQAFIGLDAVDNYPDTAPFIIQNMANAIMQSPDFSGFDSFAPPFGIILYYIFTFTVTVILLNILIALYNSAYQEITDNALDEYMALFAQKTMRYVRAPDEYVFIPPLNLIEVFLVMPFEWFVSRHTYARINNFVMGAIYSPVLLVIAVFETRSAKLLSFNRIRGEADDDTVQEWDQLKDAVDFEREGWSKRVATSKNNIEDDQATLEVRELRKELRKELEDFKEILKREAVSFLDQQAR